MKKLLALFVVVLGFSAVSLAQSTKTATATASATIIKGLTITKTAEMSFGNLTVGSTAGTVVLTPAGTRTSPDLTLFGGTTTAASFNVVGDFNASFTITLPTTDHVIKLTTGPETMIVNAFNSNPAAGISALSPTGTSTITVGATLNVLANQAPGLYQSTTPFDVTVNYN